ncbi:hypothetical protein K435DRAFT_824675 [Dendrothele bispora CBS 962.96]|uniref:Uncharacterized protein n=1 Tax=Dendrothele bispora (strain CBS 962.96) TaxID=1314807 RepID=A0A4S8KK58_DENBC|nr:hypothetical protein K435DRAFT_824675 [Dendrothele bispora CBS 962.96]
MSLLARLVGHNGIRPCRICNIRGICAPGGKTNYVPLDRSLHPAARQDPTQIKTYNPMKSQAEEVEFASSTNLSKTLATEYGIKGLSIFMSISSMVFPVCLPYDFMHLIFENVMKNLVLLWTGQFKGLDEGSGDYEIDKGTWKAVGAATSASGPYIPSAFGAGPPNVADDKKAQTADSWSFWLLYLGPVLLEKSFKRRIYYSHYIKFVKLVKFCLEFEYERQNIEVIQQGWIKWVEDFEDRR